MAETATKSPSQDHYEATVRPLLRAHCVSCHGALKQEGGLRLDTVQLAIRGGDSGASITPGDPQDSLLFVRITSADEHERMPQDAGPLTKEQQADIAKWIEQGAIAPDDEQPDSNPRDHWSFRPCVRPQVPSSPSSSWARNPIDCFIAGEHHQRNLEPQDEAPRQILVRRLYLDLIGIPPDIEDLKLIDTDTSDGWYERLVERLLNDPRHGQRWARHWMDIWRYSDWWGLGDQLRNSQQHIWHWRDWIVESLNDNLPYDEMIRQMLAADELYPTDPSKLRATGYLARNYFLFNRNQWMEETVEHVSKGLLGITMNCAKCHDHKYDPIDQVDYYRFRAIFEPYCVRLDVVPSNPDLTQDGIPRVFDGLLDAPTYRFIRGQESQPDTSNALTPGIPAFFAPRNLEVTPIDLPQESWRPELRDDLLDAYIAQARQRLDATRQALSKTEEASSTNAGSGGDNSAADEIRDAEFHVAECHVRAASADLLSVEARVTATRNYDQHNVEMRRLIGAAVTAERASQAAGQQLAVAKLELRLRQTPEEQREAIRKELDEARRTLEEKEQLAREQVSDDATFTPLVGAKWTATRFQFSGKDDPEIAFPPTSTGRRTALAHWIADKLNPLTARVAVNHLWGRHLGVPLVASTFDLGRKGSEPFNVDLLDWLAFEFMDHDWDLRHLHRLIVTSATYRMSSSIKGREKNLASDPDNRYWWRRNSIRLESQVLRDSMLQLAGTLDVRHGGPPVRAADQPTSLRRSLYFVHSNNDRNPFLTTFDDASVRECYRREESIVPQQALAMTNSRLVDEASTAIARRLRTEVQNRSDQSSSARRGDGNPGVGAEADPTAFVAIAFQTILGFSPSDTEMLHSCDAWRSWQASGDEHADQRFIWVLLNHNDFVTLR
ncbi:MAG: PSD1 and planctomycete cytochrome C domain-containing protein [Pirellulaceae bacterium]